MSIQSQAIWGAGFVLVGWLLHRWASRYDVKGWLLDSAKRYAWRAVRRPSELSARGILDHLEQGDELRGRLGRLNDAVEADVSRMGKAKAYARRGAIIAMAQVAATISAWIMLIGIVVLVVAAGRWLA